MANQQRVGAGLCPLILVFLVGCGAGGGKPPSPPSSPGFTLKLSTGSLSVIAGDKSRLTISVQPRNGFSDTVTLSVSGLLPGVNASFTQNPLPTGQTSDLVIQTPIGSSGQNANLQVKGLSGSLSDSQGVTLVIVAQPAGTPPRSTYITVDGEIHEVVYDAVHKLVFAANPNLNQVEVFSTTTRQRMTPLPIPEAYTLDVTPDGSLLWVGTRTEFFYAIDLATLQIVQRVTPPRTGFLPLTTVRAIVATANGSLFLRVGQLGVTSEGLLQYFPSTGQFLDRSQDASGVPMRFYRSADGSKVLFGFYGRAVLYDAGTNTFLQNNTIHGSPLAAMRTDGAQIAMRVDADVAFLNAQLQEIGRVTTGTTAQAGPPVYSRDGHFVYFAPDISIIRTMPTFTVVDTQSFAPLGQIPDLFLTGDPPQNCTVIDVCDSTPGGTTIRASEESGLLIGPSSRGLSFVDASNPRILPSPRVALTTANPTQGSANGGSAVALDGTNFVAGATVAFGQKLAAVTSINPNQIQVVAPSSPVIGAVNVFASFPNGWSTLAPLAFSYGPEVQYFLPQGDRTTGGSAITILGYGFGADPSQISVTIGGQPARVVGSSFAQGLHLPLYSLTVIAPPGAPGPADLTISTPEGKTTLSGAFRYWQSVQDIPITGTFSQLLYDRSRHKLYLLNPQGQRIEVFSTSTLQLLSPMSTGASPSMMTLFPDGLTLAVANTSDNTVSLINLDNSAQTKVVNVALANDTHGYLPSQIAATSTGKLFINYSSRQVTGGALQVLNLSSLAVTLRNDSFCSFGSCLTESTADGTKVYFAQVNSSGGEVSTYDAASDSFSPTHQLQDFINQITLAGDANRWAVDFRVLDSSNALESELFIPDLVAAASSPGVFGQRLHASGGLLYLPLVDGLQIYDLPHAHLLRIYGGLSISSRARSTIATDDTGQTVYALSPLGLEIATLDSVPLSIGHVSPASGPASGGTSLTIRGSGFTSGTQVRIGGVSVPTVFLDANTLRIVTPTLPKGSPRITVVNPSGESFDLDAVFVSQ